MGVFGFQSNFLFLIKDIQVFGFVWVSYDKLKKLEKKYIIF